MKKIIPIAALLLFAFVAEAALPTNYIGPETGFTRELKIQEDAPSWRFKLGITNDPIIVQNIYVTNLYAQNIVTTNIIVGGETGISGNLTTPYLLYSISATQVGNAPFWRVDETTIQGGNMILTQSLVVASSAPNPTNSAPNFVLTNWLQMLNVTAGPAVFTSDGFLTNGTAGGFSGSLTSPYIPYASGINALADGPLFRVNAASVALMNAGVRQAVFQTNGMLILGASTPTNFTVSLETLMRYQDESAGEGTQQQIYIQSSDSASFNYGGYIDLHVRSQTNTPRTTIEVNAGSGGTSDTATIQAGLTDRTFFQLQSGGSVRTKLWPNTPDSSGNVANLLDTVNTLSASDTRLLSVRNAGTPFFDVGPSGVIYVGGSQTNVIYRSGNYLVITNASTLGNNGIQITDGSGAYLRIGQSASSQAVFTASDGTAISMAVNNWVPNVDGAASLGGASVSSWWNNLGLNGTAYIGGFKSGTNYSRLTLSHSGTNGAAIFNSQSAGTAGNPRMFQFQQGGTNIFALGKGDATTVDYGIFIDATGSINTAIAGVGVTRVAPDSLRVNASATGVGFIGFTLGDPTTAVVNNGIYSGSASPEGAITADIGSIYLRRGGGAGTSFYVKESGTGNTGWVAK